MFSNTKTQILSSKYTTHSLQTFDVPLYCKKYLSPSVLNNAFIAHDMYITRSLCTNTLSHSKHSLLHSTHTHTCTHTEPLSPLPLKAPPIDSS